MDPHKLPISLWDPQDRPREKLIKAGVKSLTNTELLAILLGSGGVQFTAVDLAQSILKHYNNELSMLQAASFHQLIKFKGIGESKAVCIIAAIELGQRLQSVPRVSSNPIKTSRMAFDWFYDCFSGIQREEFWVLYLNNAHSVLELNQLSIGGITATWVDVRLILRKALDLGAVALIVAHNHPSGNLEPSVSDKKLTEKIKLAAKTLDVELLDHLIVSELNYFSFADQSLL